MSSVCVSACLSVSTSYVQGSAAEQSGDPKGVCWVDCLGQLLKRSVFNICIVMYIFFYLQAFTQISQRGE